ncbi:GntR family transcriptional regulator [Nonomuraea sp. NEAU-A123]|uniref:GntR family transcriptional regulator n=1 Tax=Nonomuraea sp. NEAU-A123 TaxID=2839649 RepID=UPI001BE42837|nr:GntR family transcriptional regulator [Nonomuraea sp. NEAU-A123]MBT2234430.1 GntR family transcriptional regulator [Nonomuraea sp. NEAU-A123]
MSVPDFSNARPAYLQIADDLRHEVTAGRLKVGERLPARRELAQRYGVAVETIRRALDELTRDGMISTQSTRGTYVVKTPGQTEPSSELEQVMSEVRRLVERLESLEDRVKGLEGR